MRRLLLILLLLLPAGARAQQAEPALDDALNAEIGGKSAELGLAAGRCTVPAGLQDAVARLEKDHMTSITRNRQLPQEVMFRRPDIPATEVGPERGILDEQIRNGGPDDWLLYAAR